jgi:hypothetical protein
MNKYLTAALIGLVHISGAQATEFVLNGTFNDDPATFRSIQSGWELIEGNNMFFVANSFYNGSSGTWGTLKQTIVGAVGALNLSFDFASIHGFQGTVSYQNTYFNGRLVNAIAGPYNLTAGRYSLTVSGTGNDTLAFVGQHATGFNILSNVSLTSAVPEPESYVMLLFGLGLIASIARASNRPAQTSPEASRAATTLPSAA